MQKLINLIARNRIVVLILLFAALLRLYSLDFVPPSLNWDEVSHGYNAYSILKTGRDEWGVFLPHIFRAYGDYKLPVYIYATVPSIAIFGLTPLGVRLVSAIAGIASVLFVYLLSQKLSKNKAVSLLAAFFMAAEPWSFFLSRVAVEANLSLFLVSSGAWFFLEGLKKKYFLPIGISLLGLSVWTYNSARIFVPLLVVILALLYKKELFSIWKTKRGIFLASCLLFVVFFLPMFWQLVNPAGQARYQWVAILDEGAIAQINQARATSSLPQPLPALLHNKATFFASNFASNYLSHFSSDFLFLEGGSHFQFNVPGRGLLYPVQLPFIILGVFWLLKRRDKPSLILLSWLLLAPIPSSLTREAPHTLRAILMQPVPQIAAALGLWVSWEWWMRVSKKYARLNIKYIPVFFYVIVLLYFMEGYFTDYVVDYRKNYSWSWQYGYHEVVDYAKERYADYDRIIVTKRYGEPHEFFLFYWPWEPQEYREDANLVRFFQSNWYWVDRFDKFYFVNDWDIPKTEGEEWRLESGGLISLEGRNLLITSPGNYPSGWQLLEEVNFLDGESAFQIYEKVS